MREQARFSNGASRVKRGLPTRARPSRGLWPCSRSLRLTGLESAFLPGLSRPRWASDLYFVDVHSQMDRDVPRETILALMDANGVHRTLLTSCRGRQPGEIRDLAVRYPDRIVPSMSTKQAGNVSASPDKQAKAVTQTSGKRAFPRHRRNPDVAFRLPERRVSGD